MTPGERRAAVRWVQTHYGLSERRACRLVGIGRSTLRYRPRRGVDTDYCENGCGSLPRSDRGSATGGCTCCCNERGWSSTTSGSSDSTGRKARGAATEAQTGDLRQPGTSGIYRRPNQQWGVDFVSDVLAWGRGFGFSRSWMSSRGKRWRSRSIPPCLAGGWCGCWSGWWRSAVARRDRPGQWPGAGGKGARSVGVRAGRRAPLHRAGQAGAERLCGELSGTATGRMSQPALVLGLERCPAHGGGLAAGLQWSRAHSALGYRSPEEFRRTFETVALRQQELVGLSE